MKTETAISILSDVGSFSLISFGFLTVIFVIIYGLIHWKRQGLIELSDKQKHGDDSITTLRKSSSAENYINRWVKLNTHISILNTFQITIFVFSTIFRYFTWHLEGFKDAAIFMAILETVVFVYMFIVFIKATNVYEKHVKI